MIRYYFLISWRNLIRNKFFSLINIFGLAIGLCSVFIIYMFIQTEYSYDTFHKNVNRIYRIPLSTDAGLSDRQLSAMNYGTVAPALKADFPEVEEFTRLYKSSLLFTTTTLLYNSKDKSQIGFNEENIYFADSAFFDVFSFPLVEGSSKSALRDRGSIVMTSSMAHKYFGDQKALGKSLKLNWMNLTVTGVLADIPENSHLKFDFLISSSSFVREFTWYWPEFYNYVLLKEGVDAGSFEKKFPGFLVKYLGKSAEENGKMLSMYLQPIADIHLKSNLSNEQSVNGSERLIKFLTVLGGFIFLIACINYINLSTSKFIERSKEVGICKISGASKHMLITQFLIDAILVNSLAFLLALFLLIVGWPVIGNILGKQILSLFISSGLLQSFSFWVCIVVFLMAGSFLAGIYPALLLSSLNTATVLKGKFSKSTSGVILRKSLVIFQYTVSIFLVSATIVLFNQLFFMRNHDLGYQKEQLLVIKSAPEIDSTYRNHVSEFKNQALAIPSFLSFSKSTDIPGSSILKKESIRKLSQDEKDNIQASFIGIDDDYLSTFGVSLVAGRNFTQHDRYLQFNIKNNSAELALNRDGFLIGGGQNKVLINERLSAQLGFTKPEEAIGQLLKFNDGPTVVAEIIGVVKNYNQISLREQYDPILFVYPSYENWRYFTLRVSTMANFEPALERIRKEYQLEFPSAAFDYFFLDDHFNNQYKSDIQFANVFSTFTALAIFISCLGLFGMWVFVAAEREKEIALRKVLGASVRSILTLFAKESIYLVLIACLIGMPIVFYVAENWLDSFAFRIPLGWEVFVLPPLLLIIIGVIIIICVCVKAAMRNPSLSLRRE